MSNFRHKLAEIRAEWDAKNGLSPKSSTIELPVTKGLPLLVIYGTERHDN